VSLYAAGEREGEPSPALVAAQTAQAVGLSYVRAGAPGIKRVRHGKGFRYVAPDGSAMREAKALARIRMLVIQRHRDP